MQAWIREARTKKGMSQRELAKAVGVSQPTIALLETADILSSAWAEFFRFPPGGDGKPADCLIFDAFIVASPAKCFVLMEWFYSEYFLNYVAVTVRAGRAVH